MLFRLGFLDQRLVMPVEPGAQRASGADNLARFQRDGAKLWFLADLDLLK